ncbi:MAG: hypothetical protein JWM47_4140 [Acidimicrobiales bacterium]|nr:hypothetical protein [Acidimicrobiales bacterium]
MTDLQMASLAALVATLGTAGVFALRAKGVAKKALRLARAERAQRLVSLRQIVVAGQEATRTAQRVAHVSVVLATLRETMTSPSGTLHAEAQQSIAAFVRQNRVLEKIATTIRDPRDFQTAPQSELDQALNELEASHEVLLGMLANLEAEVLRVSLDPGERRSHDCRLRG